LLALLDCVGGEPGGGLMVKWIEKHLDQPPNQGELPFHHTEERQSAACAQALQHVLYDAPTAMATQTLGRLHLAATCACAPNELAYFVSPFVRNHYSRGYVERLRVVQVVDPGIARFIDVERMIHLGDRY
jgi:hypothetical protein